MHYSFFPVMGRAGPWLNIFSYSPSLKSFSCFSATFAANNSCYFLSFFCTSFALHEIFKVVKLRRSEKERT